MDFTGSWTNQHGSRLELRMLGDGRVDGRFESQVGDDGQTFWVTVRGDALGDLITFHAIFDTYRTIVSWVGQHVGPTDDGELSCHWLHATDVKDRQEPAWLWYSNRIGHDVFRRV